MFSKHLHTCRKFTEISHHITEILNQSIPSQVAGDPQILEVELAKLKVLVNDIAAHQASVDTLNDAGAQIQQHGMYYLTSSNK